MTISDDAVGRRESARRTTGEFGHQSRTGPSMLDDELYRASQDDLVRAKEFDAEADRARNGAHLLRLRSAARRFHLAFPEIVEIRTATTWTGNQPGDGYETIVLSGRTADGTAAVFSSGGRQLDEATMGLSDALTNGADVPLAGQDEDDESTYFTHQIQDLVRIDDADIRHGGIGVKPSPTKAASRGTIWADHLYRPLVGTATKIDMLGLDEQSADEVRQYANHVAKTYRGQWTDDEFDASMRILDRLDSADAKGALTDKAVSDEIAKDLWVMIRTAQED